MALGSIGADVRRDDPHNEVHSGAFSILARGDHDWILWGVELGAGIGKTQRVGGQTGQHAPLVTAAAIQIPIRPLHSSVFIEAQGQADLFKMERPWWLLGTSGVSVQINPILNLHVGATLLRTRREEMEWGGMLAFSGRLGLGDLDSDGIDDPVDACPSSPGQSTFYGCPFVDKDADTVWDRWDACPDEKGFEKSAGCPIGDQDQDGIPNPDDPCPEDPQCPSTSPLER